MSEVKRKGQITKEASYSLVNITTDQKNEALELIAEQLLTDKLGILAENKHDLDEGKEKGFTDATLDRILLTENRIEDMASAIRQLITLLDPIGETVETIEKDNGLFIEVKRVPIGVIGMIYEARPNVTVDAATLAIKTGNAVILRGSSSAKHSNKALIKSIHAALEKSEIAGASIQLIEDTSRETARELFQLNEYLDVLIPRGGKKLIDTVIREATVPVIQTGAGNCHIFIDETADQEMAGNIALNAKVQRPSVCNAIETILIHENWFTQHGGELIGKLQACDVEIFGDERLVNECKDVQTASERDWSTEYLDLTVSIKLVKNLTEAIAHITQYGTKHSEAIITNDEQNAAIFLNHIDAAAVYHNASTRFTDGFEFGYGAEIGISTQKLHARGPMGLKALTTTKFVIHGNGQVRL
ncbi:glutamate-5-semialdehyde dehydrogenase [Sporosarcina sp. JAI121]|uniref:glutamate-5-semialdehyde dehydrogenase n=1 Tax=Sporosarcina sp. JAI121 TaxID=2723064 RepID=UPI0015CC3B80|nr:glutamate-5-semialdehyde dehydrogenase [Sporosarcina sp. JAI121]NYF24896.1 glutamate-5-semialdehyde dehydrogenase [Sporosarcina sp. JAI121]